MDADKELPAGDLVYKVGFASSTVQLILSVTILFLFSYKNAHVFSLFIVSILVIKIAKSGGCRDDLQVPSSPYFPAYAQGQGPPPMVQERFQSVISQLFQHVRESFWTL